MSAAPNPSSRVRMGPGGEFDVIRAILAESDEAGPEVLLGAGDDALVLTGGWVLSCDLSVEDVHFRSEWMSPGEVGYRAAAAALSDLAAMAAEARGVLASIGAPVDDGGEGAREVAAGIRDAVQAVGGVLLGGDLTASPGPLIVDVVVVGRAEKPVSRAGAVPGDTVWVTGELGGAAGAVRAWERGEEPSPSLREAFVRPSPRIPEARWLAEAGVAHALVDVSDGVAGDAGHLAAAGGVRIVLKGASVPLHPDLDAVVDGDGEAALELALGGGEDYELLFTGPEASVRPLAGAFSDRFGVALTAVGRVEAGEGVFLESGEGGSGRVARVEGGGYTHFPSVSEGDPVEGDS